MGIIFIFSLVLYFTDSVCPLKSGAKYSYVSEVKNERNCNASHIFASVSSFETAYSMQHDPINFSEQFILSNASSISCSMGGPSDVLFFISDIGVVFEPVYPYFGSKIHLPPSPGINLIKLPYFKTISVASFSDFNFFLELYPLIVTFYIDSVNDFTNYNGDQNYVCGNSVEGVHYMLAVYDENCSKAGAIRLKNNWGIGWGDFGYMNLSITNSSYTCGVFQNIWITSFSEINVI